MIPLGTRGTADSNRGSVVGGAPSPFIAAMVRSQCVGIDVEGDGVDVHEHRYGPQQAYDLRRGDKREGSGEHGVSRPPPPGP